VVKRKRAICHMSGILQNACVPQRGGRSHGATFSLSMGEMEAATKTCS
jgi:hypothetical protein